MARITVERPEMSEAAALIFIDGKQLFGNHTLQLEDSFSIPNFKMLTAEEKEYALVVCKLILHPEIKILRQLVGSSFSPLNPENGGN